MLYKFSYIWHSIVVWQKIVLCASAAAVVIAASTVVVWYATASAPTQSIVHLHNEQMVEVFMQETPAHAPIVAPYAHYMYVHVHMQAHRPLSFVANIDGIADVLFFVSTYPADIFNFRTEGSLLGRRKIFYDEAFFISATEQDMQYTLVFVPQRGANVSGAITIAPIAAPYLANAVSFSSPSCLQLAMFAHMAFFPFHLEDALPQEHLNKGFHHEMFYTYVMEENQQGLNRFGFCFVRETYGWELVQVYTDSQTDFAAAVYRKHSDIVPINSIVLAIRGTYGGLGDALQSMQGTWWCNFTSLAPGRQHSHIASLESFLDGLAAEMLQEANIYITGHSLGGYLAYVAAHRLAQMGFESRIGRVVAFSAPIFSADTIALLSQLDATTINKITHFYVPQDLIAGLVGIGGIGDHPGYSAFGMVTRLLVNLRDVHNVQVPLWMQMFSNAASGIEVLLPTTVPLHMREMLWQLEAAFSAYALAIAREFESMVWHEQVPHTWHTSRPEPTWPLIPEFVMEFVLDRLFDTLDGIFNTDTHFMMNFYPALANQAAW